MKGATMDSKYYKIAQIREMISLLCQGVGAEERNKERIEELKNEMSELEKVISEIERRQR